MLARNYSDKINPAGWLMSEKLDGVRAYWTGSAFVTRSGRRIKAPSWFCAGLPSIPLDGELWVGRGQFELSAGIAMGSANTDYWRQIRFYVFDAPEAVGGFEERLAVAGQSIASAPFAVLHPQVVCSDRAHLAAELSRVESLGGEGVMLRKSGSAYESKRSSSLLKVKAFEDAEARVVSVESTCFLAELPDGTRFGLGLAGRPCPPVGSTVTFKFQGHTSNGVPRFASFLRVRTEFA